MMRGTLPISELAPLEYRIALDVAMCLLDGQSIAPVPGQIPALEEVEQRVRRAQGEVRRAGLWIEPAARSWRAQLDELSEQLAPQALLVVLFSLPPAKLLPERWVWRCRSLGTCGFGVWRFRRALREKGFGVEAWYGFHSPGSMVLNAVSRLCEAARRPELADRLACSSRRRYCGSGRRSYLSTVALLVARKGAT
jgi:hypothetical protein